MNIKSRKKMIIFSFNIFNPKENAFFINCAHVIPLLVPQSNNMILM